MTTLPSRTEISAAFKDGTLAQQISSHFGGLDSDSMTSVVAAEFASLHNAGEIDLFRLVENGTLLALNDPSFFVATHFLDSVLPELAAPTERVMTFVDKLVTRGGTDMAASWPNAAFREWCKRDARRSAEVVEAALAGDGLARKFLLFALEASVDAALAKRIALNEAGETAHAAIAALGRLPAVDSEARADRVATLRKILTSDPDDDTRAAVVNAATNLLTQSKGVGDPAVLKLLADSSHGGDEITVHQAAQGIWLAADHLDEVTAIALLDSVKRVKPANTGTLERLDYGLAALVNKGLTHQAADFVTDLFCASDEYKLKSFDDFVRAIAVNEDALGALTVRWLKSGSAALCDGLSHVLQRDNLRGCALNIPVEAIPADADSQTFVARKALAWFFFIPTTAASVLLAILREATGEAIEELEGLIVDPLLKNYGGTVDYFATVATDDAVYGRLQATLARHQKYVDGINSVGQIPELRPSEYREELHRRRFSEDMQKATKEARKKSIFYGMIRHSVLLYGRGAVTYMEDGDEELRPVELDMKTHGVEIEYPRLETLDPIGLDYQLRLFRVERPKA